MALQLPVMIAMRSKRMERSEWSATPRETLHPSSPGLKMEKRWFPHDAGQSAIVENTSSEQPTNTEQPTTHYLLMFCVSFNVWRHRKRLFYVVVMSSSQICLLFLLHSCPWVQGGELQSGGGPGTKCDFCLQRWGKPCPWDPVELPRCWECEGDHWRAPEERQCHSSHVYQRCCLHLRCHE